MPIFFISTENRWSTVSAKDKDGGFPFLSSVRPLIKSIWGHAVISCIRSSVGQIRTISLSWCVSTYIDYQVFFPYLYISLGFQLKLHSTLFNFNQSKTQERTTRNKEYQGMYGKHSPGTEMRCVEQTGAGSQELATSPL